MKLFILAILTAAVFANAREIEFEIDLMVQTATLRVGEKAAWSFPISSGGEHTPTPTGDFKVLRKRRTHFSTLYGTLVSSTGRILSHDAKGFEVLPEGTRFIPAPMHFFIEFERGAAIHAGTLPGYPASHGCVRLNRADAEFCFEKLEVGDPIRIKGHAPYKEAGKKTGKRTSAGPPRLLNSKK